MISGKAIGLELAYVHATKPVMLKGLLSLADQYAHSGNVEQALELLKFIATQKETMRLELPYLIARLESLGAKALSDTPSRLELEYLVKNALRDLKDSPAK